MRNAEAILDALSDEELDALTDHFAQLFGVEELDVQSERRVRRDTIPSPAPAAA